MKRREFITLVSGAAAGWPLTARAQYKPEFKLSVVVNNETSWGRAAMRFADAVKFRTQGRIQIRVYFDGRIYAGQQTTEFHLLQQGAADFAMGSTINWSPQVKELNLFSLPFMFSNYAGLDAVEAGDPGKQLFGLIEQKGVIPIAWGENGFREITNSKRALHRPEDFHGLNFRVVGLPIFIEIFRALGANPVSLNFGEAQSAFKQGTVDGQENPIALIVPYQLYDVHRYITLWRYAIDPIILAVSRQAWTNFSPADQQTLREVGTLIMAEQKREARDGLEHGMTLVNALRNIYQMEVAQLSPAELNAFREKTRAVYNKWAEEIGVDLVRAAEAIVESKK